MATLTKANNTDVLSLATSWSPAQVPTSADALTFDSTYNIATAATLYFGANVTASSVVLGAITGGLTSTTLALSTKTGANAPYLLTTATVDMSSANSNYSLIAGVSSSTGSMAVTLKPGYSLSYLPLGADTSASITFSPLVDGVPSVSLYVPPSSAVTTNYTFPVFGVGAQTITIGALEDAIVSPPSYLNTTEGTWATVTVTGHPTKPTAITLQSNAPSTVSFASTGNGFQSFVYAIAEGNDGDLYFGGTFAATSTNSPSSYNARFNPTTQKFTLLRSASGTTTTIAKDASGNFYFGGPGDWGTGYAGIIKYNPTTQTYTALSTGLNSGATVYAIAIDSSGYVWVGGTFTTAGGVSVSNLAKYDPSTDIWSNPVNVTGTIRSLAFDSVGRLYIGGSFTAVGATSVSYIAKFDPVTSTVTTLGANITGIVYALLYDSSADAVYVGWAGTNFTPVSRWNNATSTWSNPTGFTASATEASPSLCLDTANNRVLVGTDSGTRIYALNRTTMAATTYAGGATAGTFYALTLTSTGDLWAGFITTTPGFTGLASANYTAKYSGGVWSAMTYANATYPQTQTLFQIYSGASVTGTPLVQHAGGTKTYIVSPNQTVTIAYRNTASSYGILSVRRGGALLETPTISLQEGVSITDNGSLVQRFTGASAYLSLNPYFQVGPNTAVVRSSATKTFYTQSATATDMSYVLRSSAGTNVFVKQLSTSLFRHFGRLDGNIVATQVSTFSDGISFPFALGGASLSGTNAAGRYLRTPAFPLGSPRTLAGTMTVGRQLLVKSPYMKITGPVVIDPATPAWRQAPISLLDSSGYSIIEWSSPSSPLLVSSVGGEFRVSSMSGFAVLGPAKYVYSDASAMTLNQTVFASSTIGNYTNSCIVMESGSGALTANLSYNGAVTSITDTFELALYNSAANTFTGDISPTRRATSAQYNILRVNGTGSLTIGKTLYGALAIYGGTVTLDYSAAGAPTSDILYPYLTASSPFVPLNISGGTLVIKGKPGANNTQYLAGSITNFDFNTYGAPSDAYLTFTQNGANSIAWDVNTLISSTAAGYPLYIQGLSGSVTLNLRTAPYDTRRIFLLGANGAGDWIAPQTGLVAALSSGTPLPTSGGNASNLYSLAGSQTQIGNTSFSRLKITTSTASDNLDLGAFSLTGTGMLIAGNNGGAYTITGTFGGAVGLAAQFIANVSTSELRLVTPLAYGSTSYLSGRGTISLGSPTTTYRSNAGYAQSIYAIGTETRIYAGSDNLTSFLTTSSLYVGSASTLRLLGTGTGNTLTTLVSMLPNAKLQVDEDWTVSRIVSPPFMITTAPSDWRYETSVAAGKTLTVNYWEAVQYTGTDSLYYAINRKTGLGKLLYKALPIAAQSSTGPLRVEAGSVEFNLTTDTIYGNPIVPFSIELYAGTTCTYNSTISHDAPFVTFGAGSVVKSNTNTVRARVYHSFTGGLTINAGEWDAQFRNAVGDGNVTVNGGTLRASAVDDEQYVLEVVGNLVFAGGSLAIGAAYVV